MATKQIFKTLGPLVADADSGALLVRIDQDLLSGCECEQQADIGLGDGDYHETSLGQNAVAVEFKSAAEGANIYIYTGDAGLTDAQIDALIAGDGIAYKSDVNFIKTAGVAGKASIYWKRASAIATIVQWNIIRAG